LNETEVTLWQEKQNQNNPCITCTMDVSNLWEWFDKGLLFVAYAIFPLLWRILYTSSFPLQIIRLILLVQKSSFFQAVFRL